MDIGVKEAFGHILRKMRKTAGLTQEELGLEADLQRNFISSLELGEKQPTLETVFKLANALNTTPAKLISQVSAHLSEMSRST